MSPFGLTWHMELWSKDQSALPKYPPKSYLWLIYDQESCSTFNSLLNQISQLSHLSNVTPNPKQQQEPPPSHNPNSQLPLFAELITFLENAYLSFSNHHQLSGWYCRILVCLFLGLQSYAVVIGFLATLYCWGLYLCMSQFIFSFSQ